MTHDNEKTAAPNTHPPTRAADRVRRRARRRTLVRARRELRVAAARSKREWDAMLRACLRDGPEVSSVSYHDTVTDTDYVLCDDGSMLVIPDVAIARSAP